MQDDRSTAATSHPQLTCAVSYPMPLTSSGTMTMQRRRPRYPPISPVRVVNQLRHSAHVALHM